VNVLVIVRKRTPNKQVSNSE